MDYYSTLPISIYETGFLKNKKKIIIKKLICLDSQDINHNRTCKRIPGVSPGIYLGISNFTFLTNKKPRKLFVTKGKIGPQKTHEEIFNKKLNLI